MIHRPLRQFIVDSDGLDDIYFNRDTASARGFREEKGGVFSSGTASSEVGKATPCGNSSYKSITLTFFDSQKGHENSFHSLNRAYIIHSVGHGKHDCVGGGDLENNDRILQAWIP